MDNDKQKQKYPLRIDKNTVIYVTEEKCNEQYAQKVRTKYNRCFGKIGMKDLAL